MKLTLWYDYDEGWVVLDEEEKNSDYHKEKEGEHPYIKRMYDIEISRLKWWLYNVCMKCTSRIEYHISKLVPWPYDRFEMDRRDFELTLKHTREESES